LSENQLRDWEDHGLLRPERLSNHRQYSLEDLDKLIIIRELINAKFAPSDIPTDIDKIANVAELRSSLNPALQPEQHIENAIPIDQHIERTKDKDEVWWRFFASHVLRISLLLISEASANSTIGILLPLTDMDALNVEGISIQGVSLIGWLSRDKSAHAFLTNRPSFSYPTDYYLYPLAPMKNGERLALPEDCTVLIFERKDTHSRSLSLNESIVFLLRRLLAPLYEEKQKIQECFGVGMKDEYISSMANIDDHDLLLEGIANMVVRLGSHRGWRFCQILLPDSGNRETIPLRLHSLVTYAQSSESPYIVGKSIISPLEAKINVRIHAYQSGYVIYRPELSRVEKIALEDIEGSISSNIALPIGKEQGLPIGVLYVAAEKKEAFLREDQQLLRIMGKMTENILLMYRAYQKEIYGFEKLIRTPQLVDSLFAEFLSENNFVQSMTTLLKNIDQERITTGEIRREKVVGGENEYKNILSFIGIDLDNQEGLTYRYGNQIVRYLSKVIGSRIHEHILSLVTRSASCQMYYIRGTRYYLILCDFTLEKAREVAVKLQRSLSGNIALEQSEVVDNSLIIPNITVHLAVSSYKYEKLSQMLKEYPSVIDAITKISQELDVALKQGVDEGGDVIISYDPAFAAFKRWEPVE
jgi:DNA-binding transcriptional MerR regulator